MEREETGTERYREEKLQDGVVACSRCGRVLRSFREWIMDDAGAVFCVSCYKDRLFPRINDYYTEMFD
jgi:formylmethanofuran dehydrogenase subunit E